MLIFITPRKKKETTKIAYCKINKQLNRNKLISHDNQFQQVNISIINLEPWIKTK